MVFLVKQIILAFLLLSSSLCFSQTNDTISKLIVSAYGEVYYSYDVSRPDNHLKPDFVYNHKRHNEVNANLLLLNGKYETKKVRANLGLMTGNYAQYNMASEPTWAQFVYEANAGVCVSEKENVWVDAGIFISHYGFESLLQTESWTLTRGMYVENVPYYISGIALSKQNKKKTIYLGAILLNGWQHIQRPDGIQKPSLGFQIKYDPNDHFTLNYCNYLGSDKPDSVHSFRHFHNMYAQYQVNEKIGILGEVNIGFENSDTQNDAKWYSLAALARLKCSTNKDIVLRTELYKDSKNIIVSTNAPNGFKVFSTSLNFNYWIQNNSVFKIEAKYLRSPDNIFNQKFEDLIFTTSFAIKI